ncbi:epithelial-stromal interaction protein 1 [Erythrolamprus reginae]|uniref:epithelial-stromal interaction protein 1 n=1 Tax=Erythrolamprus reginae TaxID=121349 RepID=UPI00396CF629
MDWGDMGCCRRAGLGCSPQQGCRRVDLGCLPREGCRRAELQCSPQEGCRRGGLGCSPEGYRRAELGCSPQGCRRGELGCSPQEGCRRAGIGCPPQGYRRAELGCSPQEGCRRAGMGCSPQKGRRDPDLESPQEHSGAFFVIPPNPAKRKELQRIANKELENWTKWKAQRKSGPIRLKPQKLGGRATESEVREKQQFEYIQSKCQQKLKKDDYERNKREAEEAEILKKKAIQRVKANKLEEKRRQQEWERQQMRREDHTAQTAEFLSQLDLSPSSTTSCPGDCCRAGRPKDRKKLGGEGRTAKEGAWPF